MNNRLSNALDAIRWVAAGLVVLTHLNNRMFIRIVEIPSGDRSVFLYAWAFVCGFAHHAVVTFFVLSGFLVGGKLLKDRARIDGPYLARYLTARVVRIYLVLVPAILVTVLFDSLGARLDPAFTIYTEDVRRSLTEAEPLVGTLLNFQTIFTPILGSNGALWSLANEFWYYVAAPLVIALATRLPASAAVPATLAGAGILVGFTVASPDFGAGFVLWSIGALAAAVPQTLKPRVRLGIAGFLGALLLFRLVMRSHHMDQFDLRVGSDLVVALALGYLLYSLRLQPEARPRVRSRFHESLSAFSYSLYAVHTPVLMLVCAALERFSGFGWHERPTSSTAVLAGASALVVVVGFAFLFSRLTEQNNARVRDYFTTRIAWGRRTA